jgi:hypothetical protein
VPLPPADDVADFLSTYPPAVVATATALRAVILATLPKVEETVDRSGRIVAYGYGPGYRGMVCTIIPSKGGVKLGVVNGASLPDPDRLLGGTGKVHRHVVLMTPADVEEASVGRLLKAALAAWKARTAS